MEPLERLWWQQYRPKMTARFLLQKFLGCLERVTDPYLPSCAGSQQLESWTISTCTKVHDFWGAVPGWLTLRSQLPECHIFMKTC